MDLDKILAEMVGRNSSDLHLKEGRPPLMRIAGELKPTEHEALTSEVLQSTILGIMRERARKNLEKTLECDFAYMLPDVARFRVNVFYQMGHMGAVFRLIPLEIPGIEELGLPPILKDLAVERQGLVLVTGPTGAGKTTTMACMIEHMNSSVYRHVVTVEDPVEFVYEDKLCTINQREIGNDTLSFAEAMKRVLRQDPDVILMGEIRDRESVEFAMHASETGHLVFSTLHTNDATQSIDRILDMFPGDQSQQVRTVLAMTLLAVISQRLVRTVDPTKRTAAVEIMSNSPNIQQIIMEGNTKALSQAIATSRLFYKMQTFNQHLCELVQANVITREEALKNSTAPGDLKLLLRGVGTGSRDIEKIRKTTEVSDVPAPAGPEQLEELPLEIEEVPTDDLGAPPDSEGDDAGKVEVDRGFGWGGKPDDSRNAPNKE